MSYAQDTNTLQYEIIKLLKGSGTHLFVVGDPNQAIFSWRGADLHGMDHRLIKDFQGCMKTHHLTKNHRWAGIGSTCV